MATEKRLIDANAFQFEPDPFEGGANGVLIWGRNGGKMMVTVLHALKQMVNNAPTVDAVEVVRCKDCKKVWCIMRQEMGQDGFCSAGERIKK